MSDMLPVHVGQMENFKLDSSKAREDPFTWVCA